MRAPVRNKADMYRRLAAGEFGNTVRQYFDLDIWQSTPEAGRFERWGVRTLTPGGPCRLNCPAHEVPRTALEFQDAGHRVNISLMADAVATVTAWLEAVEIPGHGLRVEGIEYPKTPEWSWRNSMPDPTRRRSWTGVAARMVLRRHLNANSLDDLAILLEQYPGHVVEVSAFDRCIGEVPHRNAIVWECRDY